MKLKYIISYLKNYVPDNSICLMISNEKRKKDNYFKSLTQLYNSLNDSESSVKIHINVYMDYHEFINLAHNLDNNTNSYNIVSKYIKHNIKYDFNTNNITIYDNNDNIIYIKNINTHL
jgi:hypothetical protein